MAVASRCGRVRTQCSRALQVETAGSPREGVRAQPATTEVIAMIADQAQHRHLGFFIGDGRRIGDIHFVMERFAVEIDLRVQIIATRSQQRIAAVKTGDLRRTVCLQACELAAQLIIERCIGDPDIGLAELQLIGRASIVQPVP